MNARTPSSMLLPVKTVKRKKETTPAAAPSIAAAVPAPVPALIQDEELSNYMLLAGMGKLRLDQLMYKCDALQAEKRAIESAHLYRQWIEHSDDPQKYLALFNYGSVLQTLGMADLAEEAYRLCVATEPKLAQAHINLGLVFERKGQNQQALDQWSNVVAQGVVNPTSDKLMEVTALNHIGRVYENLKQYEMAEQALRRSLQIDPKQSGVIQHWVHIRQKACMWPVYQSLPNVSANDMLMSTSPLAMLSLLYAIIPCILKVFALGLLFFTQGIEKQQGRWAKQRNLPRVEGHRNGVESSTRPTHPAPNPQPTPRCHIGHLSHADGLAPRSACGQPRRLCYRAHSLAHYFGHG